MTKIFFTPLIAIKGRMAKFRCQILKVPLVAALIFLICSGCSQALPPHVVKDSDGKPCPEAGYAFVNQSENLNVQWTPGISDPAHPHIVASNQEGSWYPDLGYAWANPNLTGDLNVRWVPGSRNKKYPHVEAESEESSWRLDSGYEWVTTDANDLSAKWTPGLKSKDHEHIYAGANEGSWNADPGYVWVTSDAQDMRVAWTSGATRDDYPNVIATESEGVWRPASGYRWVNDEAGDLRVVEDDTASRIGGAILKTVLAYAANSLAQPQDSDSSGDKFGRDIAGEVRDELLKSAVNDVVPNSQ